jgi:hypothetical protein
MSASRDRDAAFATYVRIDASAAAAALAIERTAQGRPRLASPQNAPAARVRAYAWAIGTTVQQLRRKYAHVLAGFAAPG